MWIVKIFWWEKVSTVIDKIFLLWIQRTLKPPGGALILRFTIGTTCQCGNQLPAFVFNPIFPLLWPLFLAQPSSLQWRIIIFFNLYCLLRQKMIFTGVANLVHLSGSNREGWSLFMVIGDHYWLKNAFCVFFRVAVTTNILQWFS